MEINRWVPFLSTRKIGRSRCFLCGEIMSVETVTVEPSNKRKMSPAIEKRAEESAKTLNCNWIKTKAEFQAFLRARRNAKGKTLAEIARHIGYGSGDYYQLIEAGKRMVDGDKIPLLADALDVNRQELSKLYLRIVYPNLHSTFWAAEDVHLSETDPTDKRFVEVSERTIDLLNRIYKLPSVKRRKLLDLLDMLAGD